MAELGVAEAKRRFSELVDRVARGERFVIARRGRPAVALVSPDDVAGRPIAAAPTGLAAVAGALADWDGFEEAMEEVLASRQEARDRPGPQLD